MLKHRGLYNSIEDIPKQEVKEHYEFNTKDAPDYIINAFANGEPVTVIADYDADGITASAVSFVGLNEIKKLVAFPDAHMRTYMKEKLGWNDNKIDSINADKVAQSKVRIRIPHRYTEGYGMKPEMVNEISSGLIITVDNGISAFEAIRAAKDKGLKVVMTDHHSLAVDSDGKYIFPEADCLINPHIEESLGLSGYDYYDYCGAGVILKVIEEILGSEHPIMNELYSFAVLGTVADVMPLTGDNRNIYSRGIRAIASGDTTLGVKELISSCNVRLNDIPKDVPLSSVLTADVLGYSVAPKINAPGRAGTKNPASQDGDRGAERSLLCLLQNKNPLVAKELVEELNEANENRKNLSKEMEMKCEMFLAKNNMSNDCPLVVHLPECKSGIVGLVAGYLCEKYGVPAIVFNDTGDISHGSARSPEGIDIKNLLDNCQELLEEYGGHPGAAGITIKPENIDKLRDKLYNICKSRGIHSLKTDDVYYDIELNAEDIPSATKKLATLAPFGEGCPEPVFLIKNFNIKDLRVLGDSHIKLNGECCSAIGFHLAEDTDNLQLVNNSQSCDMVGTIGYNCFRGVATPQVSIQCFPEVECKNLPECGEEER